MIVAGEASGDLHGANLVLAARELAPGLVFYGTGGRRLRSAGVDLLFDIEAMSLMGGTEVLSGLGQAWRTYRTLKKTLAQDRPDGLILIDYPELNLPLAKAARKAGVPVFYFVCPQIWAWRSWRVGKMGRRVDRRVVVFPFEVDFYRRHGLEADFVGHPLLDAMAPPRPKHQVKAELGLDPDRRVLLLMPGSRRHLVKQLLPIMVEAASGMQERYPGLTVALAQADTLSNDFLQPYIDGAPDIKAVAGRSHSLQNAADAAIVASGTSTLETALMLTPMVVIYRMGFISALLASQLIKTEHVAMANLIAGREVVPELLQYKARPDRIIMELEKIFNDPGVKSRMIEGLAGVRAKLGGPGACRRAAELLLQTIGF